MFNFMPENGEFPGKWSECIICHIFNSDNTFDCNDYRGISLLPSFCNLFYSILFGDPLWTSGYNARLPSVRSQVSVSAESPLPEGWPCETLWRRALFSASAIEIPLAFFFLVSIFCLIAIWTHLPWSWMHSIVSPFWITNRDLVCTSVYIKGNWTKTVGITFTLHLLIILDGQII